MADSPPRLVTPPADDRPADGAGLSPLLVDARCLAGLLGVSLRSIRALDRAGKLPAPIRVGRAVRWKLSEIHAWADSGCPPRTTWEHTRDARK
jgi:excisionase family DNA binding protein